MRFFLALLGVAILSSSLEGAVAEGENLLINGGFDAEQVDFPEFWSPTPAKSVIYDRVGGPEGKKPSVKLKGSGASGTVSLRQQGMTLVAGETYKLSAYIKTQGFSSRYYGLIVHNSGWTSAVGISKLPADSDWTFHEKTFKLIPSKNNEYGLAMFAVNPTGEIDFADVRLEAVSEGAREGSTSQMALVAVPRLVPLQPLLNKIPRDKPALTLKLFGLLPERRDTYECVAVVDGDSAGEQRIPVGKDGGILVNLAGLACGDHSLKTVIRQRKTEAAIIEAAYPVTIVDLPTVDRSNIRQLNNLVAELLSEPIGNGPASRSFTFNTPRDGWVFVALNTKASAPGLAIKIDDRDTVITAATDRLEAFRNLPMGSHRITVEGENADGRLVVRSIPEIFDYPPCVNSYVRENGSYDWEFMRKHILYAVTTLNGGKLPGEALDEAKTRGLRWLANFGVHSPGDPDELRRRMEKTPGMTEPQYDGFTCDELFFARATMANFSQALRELHNPENRLVYTWIVGKPSIRSLHTDFMSTCLNASRGRGRLLFEAYCHPQKDEEAAAAYLDNMIGETIRRFNAYYPNAAAGTGIIFGNFNQIPIISLEHDPAVDFKYFLDMQVNLVANSPDFTNLATTGYWGTYYGDEEMVRWSFKLMRHYAVEGKKEMLSAQYGFKYNPGFIANPDFDDGLDGWTTAPAAEGAIRPQTIAGFGKNSQGRWGGGRAGDTVCVMTRSAGKPNRISQTATGLEVGRAYCLQFVTADFRDVTDKKYHPRRYGIDVELEGAEILPDKGFVHIDRRNKGRYKDNNNVAKINLNRVIFRAKSPTQVVAFHDEKAAPGEELMINFVQLKPYFDE